jgi:type IV pilus assembly protein PilA
MLKHLRSKKKGFTLIELVMVIAIIGVLAAIIMPKFSDQKSKANDAATRANLESLRSALQMYVSEQNYVPTSAAQAQAALISGVPKVYLRAIPNAYTGSTTSTAVAGGVGAPTGTTGGWWYRYDSATVYDFYVNSTATTASPDDGAALYSDW